ncbi:DUF5723 family protein [uncultured Draconibacterium sp.]|uniref:DUF5723 family protein n=1 Tax=uncultured Draconibacterium sp. TaxID=1573823 RepID=UPI0032175011
MKDSFTKKKISFLLVFISLCFPAFSQDGNPLQFLRNISQASRLNPSYQNSSDKLIVGLPLLAGTTLNWESNFELQNIATDNITSEFYKALKEPGQTYTTANLPALFLSLKRKSATLSFSISEKIIGSTNFDEEAINFIAQGLLPYYGKNENFGPFYFSSQYYREIAFTYSTEIVQKLYIGARPKILFSKFYVDFDNAYFQVETMQESETLVIHPEGNYSVSGPLKVITNEEKQYEALKPDVRPGDYFFGFRNMGAGIDLGLSYHPTKESELSLSVLDIGFTRLKHRTYKVEFSKSLYYQKEDLYQSNDPQAPNYWTPTEALTAFTDSLPYISSVNNTHNGLTEMLPVQINASFKYQLPNKVQLGFSNHFTHTKSHSENFLSGFIHTTIGLNFELVGTLNVYNFERLFPGIGASYTGQSVQYFISTNNFLELVQPSTAKNLNLCFGVNFLFSTD